MEKQNHKNLTQAGIEALRSGNRGAARGLFRQVVEAGDAEAAIWLAYARSCDDAAERLRALDAALALEPRNLHALIMKGDHLAGAGDLRGATAYYAAVDKAAAAGVAPQLVKEVERVREAARRYSGQFAAYLQERTTVGAQASPRFAQSVDLLLGRKQLYVQQPPHCYFPELPQIQF